MNSWSRAGCVTSCESPGQSVVTRLIADRGGLLATQCSPQSNVTGYTGLANLARTEHALVADVFNIYAGELHQCARDQHIGRRRC